MGRGRHWSPRHIEACECGWWGVRVRSTSKACPRCGKWKPTEISRDNLTDKQRRKLERSN